MNSTTQAAAFKPITLGQQLKYSFSEVAGNPIYTIMASFLTFYYTDVLGINPGIIGTILLVSKIFDGISDLLAGNIIENTRSKAGAARPWILRSGIPLAISTVLLFTVPDLSLVGKIIYIFVSYNFSMTICFTMFGAAVNALPNYATKDAASRGSAYAVRVAVAGVVQLILVTFFMNAVQALGAGKRGWIIISIILAAISLVSSVITYFSMPENANPHLTGEAADKAEKKEDKASILVSVKALLRNKYWLMIVLLLIFVIFHQIATLTVGVYYATWVLNDTLLAGKIGLFHSGAVTVIVLIVPVLLNKWKGITKKRICVCASIIMLLGGALGMFSGTSEAMFYTSLVLRGVGYGILAALINGMLADTLVYGEWKTGVKTPAIGMAAYTLVQKIMIGIVTAVFGIVLGVVGYDGLAASQPASAVSFIRMFFLFFPVILYVFQMVVLHFYKLDEELPGIMKELEN